MFQEALQRTWRFFEHSNMGSDPMYEALNTPNNKNAIQKVFFEYIETGYKKEIASKEISCKLEKIRSN